MRRALRTSASLLSWPLTAGAVVGGRRRTGTDTPSAYGRLRRAGVIQHRTTLSWQGSGVLAVVADEPAEAKDAPRRRMRKDLPHHDCDCLAHRRHTAVDYALRALHGARRGTAEVRGGAGGRGRAAPRPPPPGRGQGAV